MTNTEALAAPQAAPRTRGIQFALGDRHAVLKWRVVHLIIRKAIAVRVKAGPASPEFPKPS